MLDWLTFRHPLDPLGQDAAEVEQRNEQLRERIGKLEGVLGLDSLAYVQRSSVSLEIGADTFIYFRCLWTALTLSPCPAKPRLRSFHRQPPVRIA